MIGKSEVAVLAIVLISFIIGICFYPQMPDRMASHWNAKGEVDGYMSRFWGSFFMPLVLIGIALLFLAIPRIDPLKANIEKFRMYYDGFIVLFFVFMLCIYLQSILWNVGIEISPNATLPIGVGLLLFYAGILVENAKRNWFIGIRTPWTLSNEAVWDGTHRIGGRLFKIAAIITLLGILFESYALFFILVPVLLVVLYTTVYSYVLYQRQAE